MGKHLPAKVVAHARRKTQSFKGYYNEIIFYLQTKLSWDGIHKKHIDYLK
jgi:hypothetical protein